MRNFYAGTVDKRKKYRTTTAYLHIRLVYQNMIWVDIIWYIFLFIFQARNIQQHYLPLLYISTVYFLLRRMRKH